MRRGVSPQGRPRSSSTEKKSKAHNIAYATHRARGREPPCAGPSAKRSAPSFRPVGRSPRRPSPAPPRQLKWAPSATARRRVQCGGGRERRRRPGGGLDGGLGFETEEGIPVEASPARHPEVGASARSAAAVKSGLDEKPP